MSRYLIAVFVVLFAIAVSAQVPSAAPPNPDFLRNEPEPPGTFTPQTPDGFRPSPVDMTYLVGRSTSAAMRAVLPSSFDLRTLGRMSPSVSQYPLNACWAFSSLTSLESTLLPGESCDYSEDNMVNAHGFTFSPDEGGSQLMATAYMVRWSGPINESDDPYNTPGAASGMVRKHVQDVAFIPGRSGSLDNEQLKQSLLNTGAIYTAILWSASAYRSATAAYCYTGAVGANHAVTLVGWDDAYSRTNFAVPPPGDGAFIAKNSWGPGWGKGGCFYISYYDTVVGKFNALFSQAEASTNYARIYQYDPLGLCVYIGFNSPTTYFANVFTAAGNEEVAAASWYSASPNSSYELSVYVSPSSGPLAAAPAHRQVGTNALPGYHTVKLSTPVFVKAGQRFSIVVKLTTPGYNYPIPVEEPVSGYSMKAVSTTGQSYISSNGSSWSDLTRTHPNGNVCLKAFSNPASGPVISPVTSVTLSASPSSPRRVNAPITLQASAVGGSAVEYQFRLGYSLRGLLMWEDLTGYTASPRYTWTPKVKRLYTLEVRARALGSTQPYEAKKTMTISVE